MICHLGGEVPLAFVVLTADAKNRAEKSAIAAEEIKKSIIRVRAKNIETNFFNITHLICSMLRTTRFIINICLEVWNSCQSFRFRQVGNCFVVFYVIEPRR